MCGNLKLAMEDITMDDPQMSPTIRRIFHATGKDLEVMSKHMELQGKEITELKDDLTEVKKDVSIVNAKVDTLTTVVVEIERLVKEHFSPERVQETVIGRGILKGIHTRKFWIGVLFAIALILLAGVGFYNLILTNPSVANAIVHAAAGA